MIAYYLQSSRPAAADRARAVLAALRDHHVVVVSSRPAPLGWVTPWVVLDDDAPLTLADWLTDAAPTAVVVDGSGAHVAAAARSGATLAAVLVPGETDAARAPGLDAADVLLAPWADADPSAADGDERVVHLGAVGLSARRATDTPAPTAPRRGPWRCLSIAATASGPAPRERSEILSATPAWQWWFGTERELQEPGPVWDRLKACDVLVCAPTPTNLAAAAAARVPAVLLLGPDATPEHAFLAEAARSTAPVVVTERPVAPEQWRPLLAYARGLDGDDWTRWSPDPGLSTLAERLGAGTAAPRRGTDHGKGRRQDHLRRQPVDLRDRG